MAPDKSHTLCSSGSSRDKGAPFPVAGLPTWPLITTHVGIWQHDVLATSPNLPAEGNQGCGSWEPSDSTKNAAGEGVSSGAKEAGPTCTENPPGSHGGSHVGFLEHTLFLFY